MDRLVSYLLFAGCLSALLGVALAAADLARGTNMTTNGATMAVGTALAIVGTALYRRERAAQTQSRETA
ncbi:hypothetical protein DP939_02750 [Spongiactinospora rosea]|uniref:Uncharacterized protein n=1 Tax=Spongiactinospora rosea TaxID=2248750 RepID=A0A366M5V9_9ACTN|nr:hypothetical protein [Spongiactinospora rosea]RBQ21648.1 hypothetical protein DP939_02750 [Spongiactinospora rosea]